MSDYQPTSRRPIADAFRRTAESAVRFCLRAGISADAISYLSLVASAIAAICFWQSAKSPVILLIAPAFCYVRLWFNMLDSMVAMASGSAGSSAAAWGSAIGSAAAATSWASCSS